jgi:hypothetical protein
MDNFRGFVSAGRKPFGFAVVSISCRCIIILDKPAPVRITKLTASPGIVSPVGRLVDWF